ncbi:TlpA disulfide reductase family protein [Candidatus Nitrospira allomarina]|uniref:TlpA disulfide reductase family protein n=1 Tax=Candidatus Nitrospira allomarina TaxID=3020900 RepID=A0AA96GEY2_9BACT|nr:TlpA disulfide reductase family protein [Candidatus Nitrospira allomarina]WNM59807.1 TlpA disulfide reductase family protein [Candidatus Nitrospira allomarina]
MTPLSLLASGVLGMALALGNPSSSPYTLSRFNTAQTLPPFQLRTLQGTSIHSNELKGRVFILNFWATWCGPCKEEMPSLERLRQKFPPDQLAILAVTTDIPPREIKIFWQKLNLHFDVLLDEQEELSQALMVRNLPTTVIVDTHGHLSQRIMGPREWDSPESLAYIHNLLNPK